jgi:Flp pilus assembly pilin Flp
MKQMLFNKVKKLLARKDEGASMVEYALLLALLTVAVVAAISTMSGQINTLFNGAGTALTNAATAQGS